MNKSDLLTSLQSSVTDAERAILARGGDGLVVSQYNRATILRMLGWEADDGQRAVPSGDVEALASELHSYLERYMPDRPEGHKWIILCCLFLVFVAGEPMHPREVVGWEKRGDGYACPARDRSADSLCRWCVCGGGL